MNRRTKTAFGEFLVGEIKQAGISQEKFYTAVGIKKPYFYDLLTASPPPIEIQNRMLAVLESKAGTDDERRIKFYDLAAQGRDEIPTDITAIIKNHSNDWDQIRAVLTASIQGRRVRYPL